MSAPIIGRLLNVTHFCFFEVGWYAEVQVLFGGSEAAVDFFVQSVAVAVERQFIDLRSQAFDLDLGASP